MTGKINTVQRIGTHDPFNSIVINTMLQIIKDTVYARYVNRTISYKNERLLNMTFFV